MLKDVAIAKTHRGRFTFLWDEQEDVVFDDRAVYPVLTTLATHKGEYAWDSTGNQGTLLHTVKHDKLTTGSQLRSYAQDGGNQLIAAGTITSFEVKAERRRPGFWELIPLWKVSSELNPISEQVRL